MATPTHKSAETTKQSQVQSTHNQPHPGSSVEDARVIGGKGDFGVREDNVTERTYTSRNTKLADPGAAPARAGSDSSRTSGAGGNESGAGSSSGGELDTDIIGVGTGSGVAASGKIHEPAGADNASGTSADAASGPPAKGENQTKVRRIVHGSTTSVDDDNSTSGQGAGAEAQSDLYDDASVGEVSSDEASGGNDAA